MLKVEELAKEMKVSPITIYRHIQNKRIFAIKIGGVLRIPEEEYKRILSEGV